MQCVRYIARKSLLKNIAKCELINFIVSIFNLNKFSSVNGYSSERAKRNFLMNKE